MLDKYGVSYYNEYNKTKEKRKQNQGGESNEKLIISHSNLIKKRMTDSKNERKRGTDHRKLNFICFCITQKQTGQKIKERKSVQWKWKTFIKEGIC